MKNNQTPKSLLAMLMLTVMTACGSPEKTSQQEEQKEQSALVSNTDMSLTHSTYVLNRDTEFSPLHSEEKINVPAGTTVSVLESKMDKENGLMVRLGMDVNEDSNLPSDIWVKSTEFPEDSLKLVEDGDYENDQLDSNDPFSEVARKAKKRMTYCYRFVKQYLIQTKKVRTYLPGASAYMAASILPQYGFHNTGHTPASAQEGEICIYRGGNGGNGHAEIKRGGKWWYGYGFKSQPIGRRNHAFVGCYAK